MAVFLAKCGAEMPAGPNSVPACGTPVVAAVGAGTAGLYAVNIPTQPTGGAQTGAGSPPLSGYTPVSGVPPADTFLRAVTRNLLRHR